MLGLAVWGVWLVLRGLRVRPVEGRRRCPRCDYDLSHSPTARCSECGYTLRSEREGQTPRRRWWLGVVGLAVAVGLPGYVVQMRVRQEGWAYYMRLYPMYGIWSDAILYEARSGPYLIQIKCDRRANFAGSRYDDTLAMVSKDGQTCWSFRNQYFSQGFTGGFKGTRAVPAISDFFGDGTPCFVCTSTNGGNGGAELHHILRLGPKVEDVLPHSADDFTDHLIGVVSPPAISPPVFLGYDPVFAFWRTPHAGNPGAYVVLRLEGHQLIPAPDLMRTAEVPLSPAELADAVNECRASPFSTSLPADDQPLYVPLLQTMVTLIYSGHPKEAYAFLDQAWPDTEATKQKFIQDFRQQLAESPYRETLEALGHPKLPPPATLQGP